mmetsp:Transcript_68597/g.121331  ORF Transcript_68597/g.121331 Transcript_68597/m.121331 type:complete len:270 (+) Transcript_68597:158-967(+)
MFLQEEFGTGVAVLCRACLPHKRTSLRYLLNRFRSQEPGKIATTRTCYSWLRTKCKHLGQLLPICRFPKALETHHVAPGATGMFEGAANHCLVDLHSKRRQPLWRRGIGGTPASRLAGIHIPLEGVALNHPCQGWNGHALTIVQEPTASTTVQATRRDAMRSRYLCGLSLRQMELIATRHPIHALLITLTTRITTRINLTTLITLTIHITLITLIALITLITLTAHTAHTALAIATLIIPILTTTLTHIALTERNTGTLAFTFHHLIQR